MTCIIGLKNNNAVYIGADSLLSNHNMKWNSHYEKIVEKTVKTPSGDKSLLIGSCGSVRAIQIMQYNLALPEQPEGMTDHEYLIKHYITEIRKVFKEHGCIEIDKGTDTSRADSIIAFNNELYEMNGDYQLRIVDEFASVGSGMHFALAAMYVLKNEQPENRIIKSLEAAANFNHFVGGELKVKVYK